MLRATPLSPSCTKTIGQLSAVNPASDSGLPVTAAGSTEAAAVAMAMGAAAAGGGTVLATGFNGGLGVAGNPCNAGDVVLADSVMTGGVTDAGANAASGISFFFCPAGAGSEAA